LGKGGERGGGGGGKVTYLTSYPGKEKNSNEAKDQKREAPDPAGEKREEEAILTHIKICRKRGRHSNKLRKEVGFAK